MDNNNEIKTFIVGYDVNDVLRELTKEEVMNVEYDEFLLVRADSLKNALDNYELNWNLRNENTEKYDIEVNAVEFWKTLKQKEE